MGEFFKLRGTLSARNRIILEIMGIILFFIVWYILTTGTSPIIHPGILASPSKVFQSYGVMVTDNDLMKNICYSIGLNLSGYLEAILIAVPLGFVIGLLPFFRGIFQRLVDAFRYVPLTACFALFIVAFGIGIEMKVHFLATGILIFLLPVVVQRIDDVDDVYVKTVYTLGATSWQTIRTVYIPAVLSRLMDDIRVLTAISWTYLIIAESQGNEGGIGGLIWRAGLRQGRYDKVYALLLVFILIGFIQDKFFVYLDRTFFPYKHQQQIEEQKAMMKKKNALDDFLQFGINALVWALLGMYLLFAINDVTHMLVDYSILGNLFGPTVAIIHILCLTAIGYKLYHIFMPKRAIAVHK